MKEIPRLLNELEKHDKADITMQSMPYTARLQYVLQLIAKEGAGENVERFMIIKIDQLVDRVNHLSKKLKPMADKKTVLDPSAYSKFGGDRVSPTDQAADGPIQPFTKNLEFCRLEPKSEASVRLKEMQDKFNQAEKTDNDKKPHYEMAGKRIYSVSFYTMEHTRGFEYTITAETYDYIGEYLNRLHLDKNEEPLVFEVIPNSLYAEKLSAKWKRTIIIPAKNIVNYIIQLDINEDPKPNS